MFAPRRRKISTSSSGFGASPSSAAAAGAPADRDFRSFLAFCFRAFAIWMNSQKIPATTQMTASKGELSP